MNRSATEELTALAGTYRGWQAPPDLADRVTRRFEGHQPAPRRRPAWLLLPAAAVVAAVAVLVTGPDDPTVNPIARPTTSLPSWSEVGRFQASLPEAKFDSRLASLTRIRLPSRPATAAAQDEADKENRHDPT